MEILLLADAQELETALYDALWGIAVAVADAVGEGTVVHADADGCMMLLADVEERHEAVFYLLEFVGVLLIGIFLLDELAGRIHIVARVYAHLLAVECSHVGNVRIEVNIGNEWSLIAVGTDAGIDVLHILCLAGTLCGEAHQFAASLDDFLCLTDASLSIIGIGGGHRLDADRVIATQVEGSDMCHRRGTAGIIE